MPRKERELPHDTKGLKVALHAASLCAKQPRTCAVVGAAGLGKSYIFRAICRKPSALGINLGTKSTLYVDYEGMEDPHACLRHLVHTLEGKTRENYSLPRDINEISDYLAVRLMQSRKVLLVLDGMDHIQPAIVAYIHQIAMKMKSENLPMGVIYVGRQLSKGIINKLDEESRVLIQLNMPPLDPLDTLRVVCRLSPAFESVRKRIENGFEQGKELFNFLYNQSKGNCGKLEDILSNFEILYPGCEPTLERLGQCISDKPIDLELPAST